MDVMEDGSVLQVEGSDLGGGGGGEVVQVIMQEDGQIVMPEGQFIQVNTEDGQPQFIPVTGENGEKQLIQLWPDGQAHLVHVQDGVDDSTQILQVAPDSLHLDGGHQGALTIVNVAEDGQTELEQVAEGEHQQLHLQVSTLDGVEEQNDIGQLVIQQKHSPGGTLEQRVEEGDKEAAGVTVTVEHAQNGTLESVAGQQVTAMEGIEHIDDSATLVHTEGAAMGEMGELEAGEQPQITIIHTSEEPTEIGTDLNQESVSALPQEQGTTQEDTAAKLEATKKLDMSSPIPLTTETVVVVNGKKCVLRVDPGSNHLVAYPFSPTPVPGKRGRGRPRKVRPPEDEVALPTDASSGTNLVQPGLDLAGGASKEASVSPSGDEGDDQASGKNGPSEQENSAAEGLLGLSEDGVRRSRRKRKPTTFLTDYETGAVEGVEEDADEEDAGSVDGVKRGRGRPPGSGNVKNQITNTNSAVQALLMNMGLIPKKRGRGRPRRNPLPTSTASNTGPIPAFIIQQPGGNTVMMTPVQNMDGLQRSLVNIRAKPADAGAATLSSPAAVVAEKSEGPTSIVIQNADGTKTQIIATVPSSDAAGESVAVEEQLGEEQQEVQPNGEGGEEEPGTGGEKEGEEEPVVSKAVSKTVPDVLDSGAIDDDVEDPDYEPEADAGDDDEEEKDSETKHKSGKSGGSGNLTSTAIIQLPENLVPLLLPKKTPVKIGLKASESDLEKLKCPKCDFQAYYSQQFQEHIGTHINDIHKCKCCNFLTFDKEGLLLHFREAHPKCICSECDFMADHAYIIKRHMMRHNADGCECKLCGKRYKDQYILKMHVKMVHMPAEVLYECQVCSKKFTRKAHLKRHLRIHEPEKPYKCVHCDYRGCERSDITKHLLIHEEPRHICEVCGKAFRHIKNKELHVKRHKGQRDYKCGVCDFYGYTFTDIRKHIERKHTDARNILCDKCGSAFKNDILLREHQKRQCELLMLEASLPVEEDTVDGPQTILIPSSQHILEDQQPILVDGNLVNITVEHFGMAEQEGEQQEQPDEQQEGAQQPQQQTLVVEPLDDLEQQIATEQQVALGGGVVVTGQTLVHQVHEGELDEQLTIQEEEIGSVEDHQVLHVQEEEEEEEDEEEEVVEAHMHAVVTMEEQEGTAHLEAHVATVEQHVAMDHDGTVVQQAQEELATNEQVEQMVVSEHVSHQEEQDEHHLEEVKMDEDHTMNRQLLIKSVQ